MDIQLNLEQPIGDLAVVSLLLERGADPNRGNDHGWTKLHQAGYGNDCDLARLTLAAGGRLDLFARGDGGAPLIAALFWGHREVAGLLGREPANLRVAAGLGDLELIRQLAGTPEAGAHRGLYRPHGGFPAWSPSDDPQEVLDEALVWAASADPNQRGTFGGPDHGDGVTALHLAAQSGQREAVIALLELGADPLIRDNLHGGNALGWARVGGHEDVAEILL